MKIFRDSELTDEVENMEIKLGIVDVGDVKTFKFWLLNNSPDELTKLTYKLKKIDRETNEVTEKISEEARVISAPEGLLPNASDSMIIEYAPLISIERGLKVQFQARGKELRD